MKTDMGYIRSGTIFRVLCELCSKKFSGVLCVDKVSDSWKAGLQNGRLNALSMPKAYTDLLLGDLLVRVGAVDRATVHASLEESKSNGSLHGRILLNQGLPDQTLRSALKKQARDRFSRFLSFASGICVFQKNMKLVGKNRLGYPLDPIEECRRHIALMHTSCTDNPLQKPDNWKIRLSRDYIPNCFLKYPWERLIVEALYSRGPQRVSWFLGNAPDTVSGAVSFHFLKEINVIQVIDSRTSGFSPDKANNPDPPDRRATITPGSPQSKNAKMMEESLKKWWRTMARRYHPDKHLDADPKIRRLFAQRFAEARETYHRCLKEKVLPGFF